MISKDYRPSLTIEHCTTDRYKELYMRPRSTAQFRILTLWDVANFVDHHSYEFERHTEKISD